MLRKSINLGLVVLVFICITTLSTFALYTGYKSNLSHYTQTDVTRVFYAVRGDTVRTGVPLLAIKIRVDDAPYENAWVSEQIVFTGQGADIKIKGTVVTIVVTKGMLKALKNEHQLAAVLGHEWGHYLNADTLEGRWIPIQSEHVADLVGFGLAKRAGYDACYIKGFWNYMDKKYNDSQQPASTHPHSKDRAKALNCEISTSNKINDTIVGAIVKFYDGY